MDKEVILNNNPCWKIMVRMVVFNLKKPFTFSELSRRLDLSITHPYLNNVKKFLINENILQIVEKTKKEIYYKIDNLALALLLRESDFFEYNGEIIKKTVYGYNF